jgi:DNA gyrase/topoisomerase IV subunit B
VQTQLEVKGEAVEKCGIWVSFFPDAEIFQETVNFSFDVLYLCL